MDAEELDVGVADNREEEEEKEVDEGIVEE